MDLTENKLVHLIVDIQKVFHEQKKETYSEESQAIAELFEKHKALLLSFVSGSFPDNEESDYQKGFEDGYNQANNEAAKEIEEDYVHIEDYRRELMRGNDR